MKTLAEMKVLAGQSETITISELRQQPGEVLSQVECGKSFTITRDGKSVADLHSPEPNAFELASAIRHDGFQGRGYSGRS
jgi:prevent-host-death family protein